MSDQKGPWQGSDDGHAGIDEQEQHAQSGHGAGGAAGCNCATLIPATYPFSRDLRLIVLRVRHINDPC